MARSQSRARNSSGFDNDHEAMTRRVLEHLAGQGTRRIALIAGPTQEYYARASATAYRRWCSRAGVPGFRCRRT
ncbi:substrate-binding domain-containing protein [Streptomyces sp. 5-6(2022)]|uniref:substrate-binding domain-containing protein n=1 Tax=Streptomyces sp. 5-6(2022) TaxID=2936510 RepID=UPI0023B9480D|nr:substrate-binding domain-containing protein [Streptomyces sp. 5-6(2022)]